jgi:hypothetical protein
VTAPAPPGHRRPFRVSASGLSCGAAVAVVVLVLLWTGGSMADPDVWWHVATGRLILDDGAVPHTDPWAFTSEAGGWVPTAWLSDVVMAGVWHAGGYDAVRVLRVVLAASIVVAVWLLARAWAPSIGTAAAGTAVVLVALAPFLRERPQVISYLFVAWLAHQVQRVLAGRPPGLLPAVLVTYAWANLHGMWVLAPVALLGAGVLSWWDDHRRVDVAARCTLIALVGWASTLLTPAGPRVAYWPVVVQQAAAPVTEWQRTVPVSALGLPLVAVVVAIVVRWARSPLPVPPVRVAYVLSVSAFALLAFRNVAPATVLLLPELVRPLGRDEAERPVVPRLPRAGVSALVVGLLGAGVHLASSPTVARSQPVHLAERLAASPRELRVLNSYDVGGLLSGTASPPVHVAIDGRTDLWSEDYVRSYVDALDAVVDWRPLVDRLDPDVALLPEDSEVARGLVRERGWRVTATEAGWALLVPRA